MVVLGNVATTRTSPTFVGPIFESLGVEKTEFPGRYLFLFYCRQQQMHQRLFVATMLGIAGSISCPLLKHLKIDLGATHVECKFFCSAQCSMFNCSTRKVTKKYSQTFAFDRFLIMTCIINLLKLV